MIYLDNNATTPIDPEVSDAVFSSLRRDFGNPSSGHFAGKKAREAVEQSRATIATFLGCKTGEILFTSGGTESNNLAIIGTAALRGKGHIVTSAIEHPSVIAACRHLESLGFEVTYVDANGEGVIPAEGIEKAIRDDTILLSVMHANNETGVIQPVEEIGAAARQRGIPFHVDAAQTIGKTPFTLGSMPADLLTVVPHKFYGPKGVGGLFIRSGTPVSPILYGAGHERGIRPGTENVPGIVGFAKTCQIADRDLEMRVARTANLSALLFNTLKAGITDLRLNGHISHRLPNTLNVMFPGVSSGELVSRIGNSVAASTGSACHAGSQTPSSVLLNMGLTAEEVLSSMRLSVGKDNTEEEILEAATIISAAVHELRKVKSLS